MKTQINKFYNWMSNDYPPLDGRIRILVYGLLFYFGLNEVFILIPSNALNCPPELYHPDGILGSIFGHDHTPQQIGYFLDKTKYIFLLVWFMATIGFLGRTPMLLTGIFLFVFWGVFKSSSGTTHTWHLPMYALFIYGFFLRPDRYSLDHYLAKYLKWYPFRPTECNKHSGLATKLVLIVSVFTLFSGGIAKLLHGGLEWLNGDTLYYYIENLNDAKGWFGKWLHSFLLAHKGVVTFLSIWTIALELGSIFMIFYPRLRLFFILNAMAFHYGIYLLMLPKYFPQMTVYLFLINWSQLYFVGSANMRIFVRNIFYLKAKTFLPIETTFNRKIVYSSIALTLIGILVVTMIKQKEWYPLTHIPMYSCNVDGVNMGDIKFDELNTLNGLKRVSDVYIEDSNPWYLMFYFPDKFKIVRKNPGETLGIDYSKEFVREFGNQYLWKNRLTYSFFRDINANYSISADSVASFPATDTVFFAVSKNVVKKLGNDFDFDLILKLPEKEIMVSQYKSTLRK